MPTLGPMELTIVLVIVLLLFGGAKLPQLAKGLGEGIREFKRSSKEEAPALPEEPKGTPQAKVAEAQDAEARTNDGG